MQTMAYHIQRTISTPTTFGPPAGALALAAAAVRLVFPPIEHTNSDRVLIAD